MNFWFWDGSGTLQEIEIASLIGLPDVLRCGQPIAYEAALVEQFETESLLVEAGIERMQRAAAARTKTDAPTPTEMMFDANGVPDPYAAGLAALRKDNNR